MKINIPAEWETQEWYGFTRHNFTFEGCNAWLVEPKYPAGDGRWSWCTVWPEAFVKRVGIIDLLEHGFYHVHIDAFAYKASPKGVDIMHRFQEKLVAMGLAPKANLIGMSWGGYFSLRYTETYPDCVAAIYLDAPVCNSADPAVVNHPEHRARLDAIMENYGMTYEELSVSKLNPLNNVEAIANAKIPILAAIGLCDLSVDHETNFDLFEQKFIQLGGSIRTIRRNYWGHHPHGLDNTEELLAFHCSVH